MWEETRGSARAAAEQVRQHAYDEVAKQRPTEAEPPSQPPASGPQPSRGSSRGLLVGALAAALLLGGGAFAVTRLAGDDDRDPSAENSNTPSVAPTPTPTPTVAPPPDPADTVPSGVYDVRSRIVRIVPRRADTDFKLGPEGKFTWTFQKAACDASRCTGTMKSSGGSIYQYTWDGSALGLSRKTNRETYTCVDTVTGEEVPGSSVRVTYSYDFPSVRVTSGEQMPEAFTVRWIFNNDYDKWVDCDPSPRDLKAVVRVSTATVR